MSIFNVIFLLPAVLKITVKKTPNLHFVNTEDNRKAPWESSAFTEQYLQLSCQLTHRRLFGRKMLRKENDDQKQQTNKNYNQGRSPQNCSLVNVLV